MSTFSKQHAAEIVVAVLSCVGALLSIGQMFLEKQQQKDLWVYEKQL